VHSLLDDSRNRGAYFRRAEFPRDSWHRADARTRFDDQQQSTHKEEGDEYVIETEEK